MASEVLNLGVSSVGQLSKETEKKEPIQVKSKFFATEIQNEKSLKGQLSRTTDENKIGFTYHLSEKSHEYGSIPKDYKKKQISNLRLKNKKLISFTSKIY